MFKELSNRISQSIRNVISSGRLTEHNIKSTLDAVKISLLEGDVALSVVHDFIDQVKRKIIGKNINKCLTPGQEFVKAMHSALVQIMGDSDTDQLNIWTQNLSSILIVGAQGAGKTTITGKLAKFLKIKNNKKVLVVSADVYRPAGMEQLKRIVSLEHIDYFKNDVLDKKNSIDIVKEAVIYAQSKSYDILLVDTAGCLDTDCPMLLELSKIYKIVNPTETLFVIDSMMGQVSVNHVNVFNKYLPLTGVILTKLDGDTRGGVALSVKYLTGKSIKFIGTGEKMDDLEVFHPHRVAGRILGMGDILSLIEDIEDQPSSDVQEEKRSMRNSSDFNLCDFIMYIKRIRNMGGIDKIIGKLPNLGINLDSLQLYLNDKTFVHMEAIINSMTIKERMNPDIITGSRKRRIAVGSGLNVQEVTKLIAKFNQVRFVMNQVHKNRMFKMVKTLKNKILSNFIIR